MTINAAYRSGHTPILLADYLATRETASGHINIPTVEEISAKSAVVALVRKSRLILPNFVVAGSGDGNEIETIFRRLISYSTATLTLDELRDYLELQEDLIDCSIVGHLVAGKVNTFRWRSSDQSFEISDQFIEGSGRKLFADALPYIDRGIAAEGYDFEVAREAAIQAATTLIGNEVSTGNTIAEKFGGGYDIYVWNGNSFILMDDVAYLFYRIAFPNAHDVRVYPAPFYVKIFAIGDYMAVMTFLVNTAVSRIKSEPHQRISIITPISPSANSVPDRQIADINLNSPMYGIGIIGPNIDGDDKIFTAAVAGDGYGAELFNIHRTGQMKEGLHEIRFDIPEIVMNNILIATIRNLGREAWLHLSPASTSIEPL